MSPLDPKTVNYLRELMGLTSVCIFMALEIVFSSSSSKKMSSLWKHGVYSSALQKSVTHYLIYLLVIPLLFSSLPSVIPFLPLAMFSPKENISSAEYD